MYTGIVVKQQQQQHLNGGAYLVRNSLNAHTTTVTAIKSFLQLMIAGRNQIKGTQEVDILEKGFHNCPSRRMSLGGTNAENTTTTTTTKQRAPLIDLL